jgi:putative tryptophan/tyrosine transport system substrate-binding protein
MLYSRGGAYDFDCNSRIRGALLSRRTIANLCGLVCLVSAVLGISYETTAQPKRAVPYLAVLNPFSPPEPGFEVFKKTLAQLGFAEGDQYEMKVWWAYGKLDRLPPLAAELVTSRPDVIFAPSLPGLLAAKQATVITKTPIVTVACDPLDKLVENISKPGGNATGFSCIHSELAGKRVELMRELLPELKKTAVFFNPVDPNKKLEFNQIAAASARFGMEVREFEVRTAEEIQPTFDGMKDWGAQAVIVLVDPFAIFHREQLARLAIARQLPLVSGFKEFVEVGALMSYGAERAWIFRGAADYVAKIMQGANVGELPVQEPSTFELYLNARTANELRLRIPWALEFRADRVLE